MIDAPWIKKRRLALGLSQTEASRLAGWGEHGFSSWSLIERGLRKSITLKTLAGMAKALRCHPRQLIAEKIARAKVKVRLTQTKGD